jgi:hypothetical protein
MRWSDINLNPDNPSVVSWRLNKLQKLKQGDIPSVRDFLFQSSQDAEVLADIGYANHDPNTASTSGIWSHSLLREMTKGRLLYGVDPILVDNCDENCIHLRSASQLHVDLDLKKVDNVSIIAMNVVEHVSSPQLFLEELSSAAVGRKTNIWLSTPNPSWIGHSYDWWNMSNQATNVDHVALFGPSELIELAERCNLRLVQWGYLGIGDMPKSFRPGPGLQRIVWWLLYSYSRRKKKPPAYNQIWIQMANY